MDLQHLNSLAKEYHTYIFNKDQENADKIREVIKNYMKDFTVAEQKEATDYLREKSIDVNGHAPRETTGYGIVRDIFCEHLLNNLVHLELMKISAIQNDNGQNPQELEDKIKDAMSALPDDQFENLCRTIRNNNPQLDHLDPAVRNKQLYAHSEVSRILNDIIYKKSNPTPDEEMGE